MLVSPVGGPRVVLPQAHFGFQHNRERKCAQKIYNWHSADSLGWPLPMLKYKYVFQIKYVETILSSSTHKLLWFEITKNCWLQFKKINLLCRLL